MSSQVRSATYTRCGRRVILMRAKSRVLNRPNGTQTLGRAYEGPLCMPHTAVPLFFQSAPRSRGA